MAQPSLSEQIRRLEAELGVPLFARAGRGLELTEAGRLLRPHAERTVAAAQEAAESVREVRDLTGGTVAFGTFGSAHHYLLGGLVAGLPHAPPERPRPRDRPELRRGGRRGARGPAGGGAGGRCRSTTAGSTCGRRCARSCSTSAPIPSACASR